MTAPEGITARLDDARKGHFERVREALIEALDGYTITSRAEAEDAAQSVMDDVLTPLLHRVCEVAEELDGFGSDRDRDNEDDDEVQAASAAAYLRAAHLLRRALDGTQ